MDHYAQLSRYITDRVAIGDEELRHVLSYFRPLSVKRKELVSKEGDPARRMFFVAEGCLRIFFTKADGAEVTRRFTFKDFFSTSLVSFISGEPLNESTQAVFDSEILYIPRLDFYSLVDSVPAWEKFYRTYLEYAYVTNTNRLQSFLTLDATERYKLLLHESPHIVLSLPNKLVANYLNISQEALSRLKSKI